MDSWSEELLYVIDPVERINRSFGLGFALDSTQERIVRDESKRIIVNCTRQWGKTTTVSAMAAALTASGAGLILVVAPVERQARELFRKIRESLRKTDRETRWPEENKLSLEMPNGSRVVALPAKGENIRGYTNPAMIIIDEAAFVADEDYRAIRPMLSHGARLILMSTPFGKRGFFHDTWENAEGWSRYSVPATECTHILPEFLAEERAALGPWWYSQEYECAFQDNIAGFFDMDAVRESLEAGLKPLEGTGPDGSLSVFDDSIKPLVFGGCVA